MRSWVGISAVGESIGSKVNGCGGSFQYPTTPRGTCRPPQTWKRRRSRWERRRTIVGSKRSPAHGSTCWACSPRQALHVVQCANMDAHLLNTDMERRAASLASTVSVLNTKTSGTRNGVHCLQVSAHGRSKPHISGHHWGPHLRSRPEQSKGHETFPSLLLQCISPGQWSLGFISDMSSQASMNTNLAKKSNDCKRTGKCCLVPSSPFECLRC